MVSIVAKENKRKERKKEQKGNFSDTWHQGSKLAVVSRILQLKILF